jgi:hypothetical protein
VGESFQQVFRLFGLIDIEPLYVTILWTISCFALANATFRLAFACSWLFWRFLQQLAPSDHFYKIFG